MTDTITEEEDPLSIERWAAAEEGMELLQEAEFDAAVDELTKVISSDPENEYAHFFLGHAYFEKQELQKALKCYVLALELKPEYFGAMVGAGHTLRMMGEHARAMRMAKQVLRKRPDDPEGLYLLGLVHFQRGEWGEARGFLERFLKTGPEVEVALEVEGMLSQLREHFQA